MTCLFINLPKKLIKKLRSVLNHGIRFILSIKDFKQDLIEYYKQAHILPIEQRIDYKVCLICFKTIHNMVPVYFEGLLSLDVGDRPNTRLRPIDDDLLLKVKPLPPTLKGTRRFSFHAPNVWNKLPLSIRSIDNLETFKRTLKTHMFASLG